MIEKNALLFPSGLPDQAPLISGWDHLGSITLSPFLYAFYLPKNAIHSASATHAYTFIWGMVGENQDFDDMDDVDMKDLR